MLKVKFIKFTTKYSEMKKQRTCLKLLLEALYMRPLLLFNNNINIDFKQFVQVYDCQYIMLTYTLTITLTCNIYMLILTLIKLINIINGLKSCSLAF